MTEKHVRSQETQSGQILPPSLLPSSFINVLKPAVFLLHYWYCTERLKLLKLFGKQQFLKQLCLNFRHEISLNIKFLRKIQEISILYSFCLHWILLVDKKGCVECFYFYYQILNFSFANCHVNLILPRHCFGKIHPKK